MMINIYGFEGESHHELESTQTRLKQLLDSKKQLKHGFFVCADLQVAGRGRGLNEWASPPGNLYVSILLKDLPFSELTWIPHWLSVCVLRALLSLGVSKEVLLKWPNDLWIDRIKKISGILCEKKGDDIIAGIGLNLNSAPHKDSGIAPLIKNFSRNEVLAEIFKEILRPIQFSELKAIYEKHALFQAGAKITWIDEINKKIKNGEVIGLGHYGELVVNIDNKETSLFTEDVREIRIKA